MAEKAKPEEPAEDGRPVEVREGEEPDDSDELTGGDIPDEETVEGVGY
jgi:hypothetical protein